MARDFSIGLTILVLVGLLVFSLAQAQTPAAPTNLGVQAVSSCAFKVIWTPPTGADAYDVGRNDIVELNVSTSDEGTKKYFIDKDNDMLWQAEDAVDHIDPGEVYSYRVRAKNTTAGTQSGWTNPVSAPASALPAKPGAPRDITAVAGSGRIDLEWQVNAPTSALFSTYGGFEIWRAVSTNNGNTYSSAQKIARVPSSQIASGRYFYSDNQSIDFNNSYRYFLKTQEVGGEGCNPDRAEHIRLSDDSPTITVPVVPSNFVTQFVESPRKITLNWNDNSRGEGNETRFNIQRSTNSSFTQAATISFDATANATSYDDTNIEATGVRTYWYRIRSCAGNYCSPFTASVSAATGVPSPHDFVASLAEINGSSAIVNLSWQVDLVLSGQRYQIERSEKGGEFSGLTTINSAAARTYPDNTALAGKVYIYRIRSLTSSGNSGWALSNEVSTDVTPIIGWAWSGHGLGWVRLSYNSSDSSWGPTAQANDSYKYGVFLDNVSKQFSGYAWSPYAGWLSFNEGASVQTDGTVAGWAKFVDDGQGRGLGRSVSLSQKSGESAAYGLDYATSTDTGGNTIGQLRGFAWGGDTLGWITFGGPILKNVVQKTDGSFDVTYENQMDYNKVDIYYMKDGDLIFDKINPTTPLPANRNTPQNPQHKVNVSVPNVEPNTNIQFKVRGILP